MEVRVFSAAPFPVPPYPQYMCQLIVIPIFSVCNCVGGFAVVERRVVQYVYQRGITYYFVRRVPKDVQEYYKLSRIVICLKTNRKDRAVRVGMSIAQRLEDYWLSLRLSKLDIPALHLLRDKPLAAFTSFSMGQSEADTIGRCITMGGPQGKERPSSHLRLPKIQHHLFH